MTVAPTDRDADTPQSSEVSDGTLGIVKDTEKNDPDLTTEGSREYPTGIARALIIGPVTLTYFLFFLDLAVLSTATPAITSEFNSLVDVGWYGGAYQLGSSAFQPLTGKIFRYFSIKWSFLAFFFVFEVGSLLCGAAQNSAMFIIGRAIAGVGSSGISNGALTIISAVLPPREQARFLGVNMGLGQLGLALGPIIGGLFTEYVSWRWCFYINLPVGGVVAILLLLFRIPEHETKPPAREVLSTAIKSLDLPGFMLISPAAVMFLLGLQYGGNQFAWNSSVVIGLLVGAAAMFVLFLFWERRQGDDAMVPFAMMTHRIIWSAAGNMFFLMASILVADFYLAIYFQAVHDDPPLMSGVHMLPTTLGIVLFTMVSGTMIEMFGYYLPWVVSGGALSAIGYGLLSLLSPTTTVANWIGYQVLYGVGGGCMAAGAYIAIQNLVPTPQIPTAMSIIIFSQNMGGAISLVAANAIFSNTLRSQLQERLPITGIAPDVIINSGVRSVRELVPGGALLAAVLQAYSNSADTVMYLGVAVSVAAFAFAWGLGWKDIHVARNLNAIKAVG
ncbi:major facilitator superfamily-domain-containing protein [Chaetomium tenue]|uniref:Major facilitator superfamily-domain-containing protein n=1 Tax=Chaetomium tenue TaxID=1854479 RepID=A0ACB7PTT0_9PEZI|nr:major facilitator superfamily-domain-containing protein [Chaetomium globosum]